MKKNEKPGKFVVANNPLSVSSPKSFFLLLAAAIAPISPYRLLWKREFVEGNL